MFCPVCSAQLADGAQFCPSCGTTIGAGSAPPAPPSYDGGQQQYGGGQDPYGAPPAAPPSYGAPQPPQYGGAPDPYAAPQQPSYGAPPPSPYGGAPDPYGAPQQPYGAPQQPPYGAPPQYGGQPPYGGAPTPPPGKSNLMKILIPVGVVVLAGIVFLVLWLTGVIGGGGGRNEPQVSSTRNTDRPTSSPSDTPSDTPSPTETESARPTPRPPTASPEETSAPPTDTSTPDTPTPPSPTGPTTGGSIPGSGGSVQINGLTEVTFTPSRSALWIIYTSDCGGDDPMLDMYGPSGSSVGSNDDGGDGYNAKLIMSIDAGSTYTIEVSFFGGGPGTCTLTAKTPVDVPATGGDVRIDGTTGLVFVPAQTGSYEFRTSNSGNSDPFINIYDQNWNEIADDDDSGGGYDVYLSTNLNAGATYHIWLGFWDGYDPTYSGGTTLTITPGGSGGPVAPTPPPTTVGGALSSEGGSVQVNGAQSFTFTSGTEGLWIIYSSDCGDSDPFITVTYDDGSTTENDDSGDGYNARMVVYLYANETINISVTYYANGNGNCVLNVKPPIMVPGDGGQAQVVGVTGYRFTPDQSGTWEFRSSDSGSYDPVFYIYDANGNRIADDDDSGGGYDFLCTVSLTAGQAYDFFVAYYDNRGEPAYTGTSVITVQRR